MSIKQKSGEAGELDIQGIENRSAFVTLKDQIGNDLSRAHRENIPSTQEGMLLMGKNDDTAVFLRTDRKGSILTGNYVPEIQENFEGAVINVQKWTPVNTSFVPAQSTLGGYNFNGSNLTTLNAVAILQSQRLLPKFPRVPLHFKSRLRHNLVAGSLADLGFGVPTGTTTIVPNGAMFRMTASGVIQGVITVNGVETAISNVLSKVNSNGNTIGGNLNMSAAYYTAGYFVYDIIADDDNVVFTIQDSATGELIGELSLSVPVGQIKMWGATALPIYMRVWNNVAPSTAPVFAVTELQAMSLDWNLSPTMSQLAGSLNLSAGRQPFTGAQNENHTNSVAPVSATLSNVAAGYATLGGKFQFVAVAGAETDYALFGFTVPAGSRFLCEGIKINTLNTGAAVATTATILEWALGFNSSAISLATANIVRRQVGMQSFAIGAAIGAQAGTIDMELDTPEVVESGRFVHVILRMPIGTATASQIIRGQVFIKGRFI